jgi:inosose dehydratase
VPRFDAAATFRPDRNCREKNLRTGLTNQSPTDTLKNMPKKNSLTRRDAMKIGALSALGLPLIGTVSAIAQETDSSPPSAKIADKLKLGVATISLTRKDIPGVIAALKQLKIDSASLYKTHLPWETATPDRCRAVVKQFTDAGLVVSGTGVINFTTDEAAARAAFDNVQAAGLKTMCARPTPEALPLVEKLVKEYDIKVAIHNHGPTDLYPTGEATWKAVQPYDQRIGLCIDVGHAWRAGGDPAAEIRHCRERLYQVHLKDTRGPKGTGTKDPSPVVVGHGDLDIKGILAALVQIQFQYRADFEYEEKAEDQLPGLAESVGYVRGILSQI